MKFKFILKGKKAFTLVEVIAVIVILGIILGLSIPLVTRAVRKAQLKEMVTQEDTLKLVGKDYFLDDRARLPKEVDEIETVQLFTLIDEGYITNIKDYNREECDLEGSYVDVTRKGVNDYEYESYLLCGAYETGDIWGDWTTEKPTEGVYDTQDEVLYDYQELDEYDGTWGEWADDTGKTETIIPIANKENVVRQEYEYRYREQEYKWSYISPKEYCAGSSYLASQPGNCSKRGASRTERKYRKTVSTYHPKVTGTRYTTVYTYHPEVRGSRTIRTWHNATYATRSVRHSVYHMAATHTRRVKVYKPRYCASRYPWGSCRRWVQPYYWRYESYVVRPAYYTYYYTYERYVTRAGYASYSTQYYTIRAAYTSSSVKATTYTISNAYYTYATVYYNGGNWTAATPAGYSSYSSRPTYIWYKGNDKLVTSGYSTKATGKYTTRESSDYTYGDWKTTTATKSVQLKKSSEVSVQRRSKDILQAFSNNVIGSYQSAKEFEKETGLKPSEVEASEELKLIERAVVRYRVRKY